MSEMHSPIIMAEYGLDAAMEFHLCSRVFPRRDYMKGVALRAVRAMNEGAPQRKIRLNDSLSVGYNPTYRGRKSAPAWAVCDHLNLWWAVKEQEADDE